MKRLILFLLFLTVFFLNETFNVSDKLQPIFYRITFPFLKLRATAQEVILRLQNRVYPGDVYLGYSTVGNLFFVTGEGEDYFYILGEAKEGAIVLDPLEKRFLGIVVEKGPISKVMRVFSDDFVEKVRVEKDRESVAGVVKGGHVPRLSIIEDIDVTGWKVYFESEKWNVAFKEYLFIGTVAGRDEEYFLLNVTQDIPDRVIVIGVVE